MKKKFLVMMMCGCMALTACGSEKEQENVDATPTVEAEDGKSGSQGGGLLNGGSLTINPADGGTDDSTSTTGAYWEPQGSVVLGNYLNIEVDKVAVEVTDAEVQEEIDYFLYYQSELQNVEGRNTIEKGDIVNLDYVLVIDGEEVDSYDAYEAEIGAGDLPELDNRLIGCELGATEEFVTTIIDDYIYPDYVGQTGIWTVTINAIQERITPELTDELISANTDYATVEEYKQSVYDELYATKEADAENDQIVAAFEVIIANSEFSGLSDDDVQSYVDEMVSYYESYASMYGIDIETFVSIFTGGTYDDFLETAKEQGEYVVRQNLILEAVMEKESLKLTDQEYTEGLTSYAVEYGYDSPEEFEEAIGKEEIEEALLLDKAYYLIVDSIIVK